VELSPDSEIYSYNNEKYNFSKEEEFAVSFVAKRVGWDTPSLVEGKILGEM